MSTPRVRKAQVLLWVIGLHQASELVSKMFSSHSRLINHHARNLNKQLVSMLKGKGACGRALLVSL